MIKSSVEKLAADIGYDIGNSNDVTQAELLNGFCKALANSMQNHALDLQVCYIVEKLDTKSCDVLKRFYEFIELKNPIK